MTRSACTNHPDAELIEIPSDVKFWCARCHHLVAPELEIVAVVEEEPEIIGKGKVLNIGIAMSPTGAGTETAIPEMIKEVLEETVVEAEPEPSTNVLSGDIDIGPLEDKIAAKDVTIAELKAKLAELTKDGAGNPS